MDNTTQTQTTSPQAIKPYAQFIVTQLVQAGAIADDVGGSWKLTKAVFGMGLNTAFANRDDLVNRLVAASIDQYGQHGLRVAS